MDGCADGDCVDRVVTCGEVGVVAGDGNGASGGIIVVGDNIESETFENGDDKGEVAPILQV